MIFLGDGLQILLPSVAHLHHTIPAPPRARTVKLLQLTKQVVQVTASIRRETYIATLFTDQLGFLGECLADLSATSVFILCCLCRGRLRFRCPLPTYTPEF